MGHGQSGWSSQLLMSVRCGPLASVTCKIQCHRLMAIVQLLIQWACPLSGWMFVSEYVGTLPFSFVIIASAEHTLSQIVSVCCGVMLWLLSNQNCFLFLFFQKWMAYIDWLKNNFLSRKWISGVSCEINLTMVEKNKIKKSETRMAASVLIQNPNWRNVKNNAYLIIMTPQTMRTVRGKPLCQATEQHLNWRWKMKCLLVAVASFVFSV